MKTKPKQYITYKCKNEGRNLPCAGEGDEDEGIRFGDECSLRDVLTSVYAEVEEVFFGLDGGRKQYHLL